MKKVLAGFLGMMMVAACLTGCGSNGGAAGKTAEEKQTVADKSNESSYPEKNIEIILPYGAGSSTEAILRVACQYVEEDLGFKKKFIISNQEGGSGEIGLTAAFNAPHDGYTLAMFHSPHIALKLVRGDACAFSYEDFAPITNFTTDPGSWLINSKSAERFPDFKAVIDEALEKPGTISVACGGLNTSEGRLIKQIQRITGAEFKIVPIDNDAEFVSMLRGNHVDVLVTQVGDVMGAINEGTFIPLVVGTNERIAALPDTPTFMELGYEIESYSMRSLAAVKGIPDEIYNMLCDSFAKAMQSEEVLTKAQELGMAIDFKTPEEIQKKWDEIDAANRAEWEIEPWQ